MYYQRKRRDMMRSQINKNTNSTIKKGGIVMNKVWRKVLSLCVAMVFLYNQIAFGGVENYSTLRPQSTSVKMVDSLSSNLIPSSEGLSPVADIDDKSSSAGLSPEQLQAFQAFYDVHKGLTVDQMNAARLEGLIDKGLLTTAEIFYLEDELANIDLQDTINSLLKGELNIYIYSAGEASRMMASLVKYGLVSQEDSQKPEILRKYRRWNTNIWELVELIHSKKASLETLLKEKESELSRLSESDKAYKDTKADVATLRVLAGIAVNYTQIPTYATDLTIGPRHIKALVDGITKMAQRHGFDAKKVLSNLKLTLGVNNEILEDAAQDLKDNNFFGLNPANIVFVMNDFSPAYKLVDDKFVLAEEGIHTNYNHGFNIINANTEYSSYVYDPKTGIFVLQKDKALDYLKAKGAKTTLIHRSNDLITMVPEQALDLEMYAAYRHLNQTHSANVLVEVLNNFTGQKGGLLLGRADQPQGLGFLVEGLATKTTKVEDALKRLTQGYQSQGLPGIPYNRLYQYFDIAQAQANLDTSNNLMPMSIKDEAKTPDNKKVKGFYSPEIPTGDQTIVEGSRTVGVMRRNDFLIDNNVLPKDSHYTPGNGTLIHDFKELKDLPAAIAVVDNQDKGVLKTASAGTLFDKAQSLLLRELKRWGPNTKGSEKIDFIERLANEVLDPEHNVHFHLHKLMLYQSLRKGFRTEDWEIEVAGFQDDEESDDNKERALDSVQKFLNKARENLLIGTSMVDDLSKLRTRIDTYWQLRWLFFNTAVDSIDSSLRLKALEYIFECLKGNSGIGDTLWKNGKEVLTEFIESNDPHIWKPALERSLESLANPAEEQSAENITESLNVIKFESNPELVSRLVHVAVDQSRDKALRLRIIERVLPEIFARSIKGENIAELQKEKEKYIKDLVETFVTTDDPDISKALAGTISVIGNIYGSFALLENKLYEIKTLLDTGTINERQLTKLIEVIAILGGLRYEAYPANKLRDSLVDIALKGGTNINRPKLVKIFSTLREESAYALLNIAITVQDSRNPREDIQQQDVSIEVLKDINSIMGTNLSSKKDDTVVRLMREKGPRNVLNKLLSIKGVDYEIIQSITGMHIDQLVTLTLNVPSEVPVAIESRQLGVITDYKQGESIKVDGVLYTYQGVLSQSHSNPIEQYTNMKGHKIITKGGDNYTLMIETIGHDLFARQGIPVPRMTLHTSQYGKSIVVMDYLDGYIGNLKKLEPRYFDDTRIQNAILLSALIKDTDRTPWNMMFRRQSFELTEEQARAVEDELMHIDFGGALFSKAAGGFNPFPEGFYGWKSGSLEEFITTTRHDMPMVVNKAYERVLKDRNKMIELAKSLAGLSDKDIRDMVESAVRAINLDLKDVALSELDLWIAWCEIENREGFWNRKARRDRIGPISMFKDMREKIAKGENTFSELISGMLISRKNDILNKEFILRPAFFEDTKSPLYKQGYEYKWGVTESVEGPSGVRRFNYTAGPNNEKAHLEVFVFSDNVWHVSNFDSSGQQTSSFVLENTSYDNLGNARIKTSSAGTLDQLLGVTLSTSEAIDFVLNYSYTPVGAEEVLSDMIGNVVYSDSLKQSEALQARVRQAQQTGRKFFLINKESHDLSFLRDLGIERSSFVHVLHQNSYSSIDIAKIVAGTLRNQGIKQVRVFATDSNDLEAWSNQDLIEALVLLLTDKRFEIISDYSQQHIDYIRTHQQVLIAA
jgi:hypothetical protein